MRLKQFSTALKLSFCIFLALAPGSRALLFGQESPSFFPLSEIHPGLKGIGKTIFQGDQMTEFQVEVLGILRGVLAPKHDAILVKLSGPQVEKTGVVAGMSGSPVYIDGKLVGAVAVSFPFSKEPYGLVTPIQDIVAVAPPAGNDGKQAARPAPENAPSGPGFESSLGHFVGVEGGTPGELRFVPDRPAAWPGLAGTQPANSSRGALVAAMRLPVRFGGFDEKLIEQYAPQFRALGLEPLAGGALTGAPSGNTSAGAWPPSAAELDKVQPGQMISMLFMSGDFNLAADCTVTLREGDRVYACGHQVFQLGQTDIPFAPAHVLATIPALTVSFKVDDPGAPVGSIHQDRFGAIYGKLGDQAQTIPVSMSVKSDLNRTETYRFRVAEAPLISPLLLQLALVSAVGATERTLGPSTLSLNGKIRLTGGDSVNIDNVLVSDSGPANAAAAMVSAPLNALLTSDFPGLHIEGIDLNMSVSDQNRAATLESAWTSKFEVRPGDSIDVMTVVRTPAGESFTQRIPVTIPANVNSKMLALVVGSGAAADAIEGRLTPLASPPRDLHRMVDALNKMRRNNRIYAVLLAPQRSFRLAGDEFPAPPPSLLQTFLSDAASAGRVTMSSTSVVGDFATDPTPYTVTGQQTLQLKVISMGE
ncbi:MAG TPA: SpoIVB peptidase S55 domain-containing protein [Terriglobia bacterium]|nr:SpoIVB peptidase S55 domain-containing protein [Terriglobia bacterium]